MSLSRNAAHARALGHVEWSRKPIAWTEVSTTIARSRIPADLLTFSSRELGIKHRAQSTFALTPDDQFFLVLVDMTDYYLVNTEGYDYARYIVKVREG